MKGIYRITACRDAASLSIDDNEPYARRFEEFTGESLIELSPNDSFRGQVSDVRAWNAFYRIAPGGMAISEEAWLHCMDMYYVITENDVELLSVQTNVGDMRIVNPREYLPVSSDPSIPCDLKYANTLFRIEGRPRTDIYCLEGLAVPDNEFKYYYEKFGFSGLEFELIWSE